MKTIRLLLPLIFLCASLGGCATSSSPNSSGIKVVLVSALSKAPLRPALKQESRIVTISSLKKEGAPQRDGLKEHDIDIKMTLSMPKAKQQHGKARKVAFPVFVALLDDEDNVLDRHDETINVTINGHALSHPHKITYLFPEDIEADSETQRLLVGFNGNAMAVDAPIPQYVPRAHPRPYPAANRMSASKKRLAHKKGKKWKKKGKKKKRISKNKVKKWKRNGRAGKSYGY